MIEVQSCARLHLGLLDNNGEMGRLYGSIGVAISRPKLVLKADAADTLTIEGADSGRVAEYARRFIREFGFLRGAHIKVEERIPAHVGLGSGTQLALAVGTALSGLSGRKVSLRDIALKVGRGEHSGIGISTFRHGGFILDGGRRIVSDPLNADSAAASTRKLEKDRIPPVLFRKPMPKSWYFVVVIPKADPGLSGKKEDDAFVTLPRAPSSLVEKISRVLLIQMLPALVEKDIANFGQALTRIQCMVGDCFASVQGGRFANSVSGKIVDCMLGEGAAGIGQSSWGPTVYGLVEGKTRAHALMRKARAYLDAEDGGEIFLAQPQNRGAQIRVVYGSERRVE